MAFNRPFSSGRFLLFALLLTRLYRRTQRFFGVSSNCTVRSRVATDQAAASPFRFTPTGQGRTRLARCYRPVRRRNLHPLVGLAAGWLTKLSAASKASRETRAPLDECVGSRSVSGRMRPSSILVRQTVSRASFPLVGHRPSVAGPEPPPTAFGRLQGHHRGIELLSPDWVDVRCAGLVQPSAPIGVVADYMQQRVSGEVLRLLDRCFTVNEVGSTIQEKS